MIKFEASRKCQLDLKIKKLHQLIKLEYQADTVEKIEKLRTQKVISW
jgi:hypothetical protein